LHVAGELGNVWSFNFFFYNRKLKRILYFACRGKTHAAANSSGEDSSDGAYNSDAEVTSHQDCCLLTGSHGSIPLSVRRLQHCNLALMQWEGMTGQGGCCEGACWLASGP
jgi:hypothetical protein